MTISISAAPAATEASISRTLVSNADKPAGKPADTAASLTGLPARAARAEGSMAW